MKLYAMRWFVAAALFMVGMTALQAEKKGPIICPSGQGPPDEGGPRVCVTPTQCGFTHVESCSGCWSSGSGVTGEAVGRTVQLFAVNGLLGPGEGAGVQPVEGER